MAARFLGNGWRFPILPDESGGLGYVDGDASVEQSLRVLLLTELGERVMRPGFGSRASKLVFAPGSVAYLKLIETSVREAVVEFEPRVELELVAAEADAEDATRITVSIAYRVRRTNTRQNLVFPYYLGTTGRP